MWKIKGIIFDMDGVLVDTERISFKFWEKSFEKYGYKYSMDTHLSLIGRNNNSIRNILGETFGTEFPLDEICNYKSESMIKYLLEEGTPLKIGVFELLDYLRENNYKIAVATSTHKERAIQRLESVGIKEKFDDMVCGDEIEHSKPNPEIFLKAAEKLGLKPEECIVIEDSPAGVEAGYKGGMTVINVPDMKMPDEEMKKYSSLICNNLLDVKEYLETKVATVY
ncbi:MAG: HAD family phosphatase [Peptostreptococcaceae bacterium]|nr:HAD family phosphatase [Peptostreptococcaceae bacterium]